MAQSPRVDSSTADVSRVIEDLKTKKAWFEANQARVTAENKAKAEAEIRRILGKSADQTEAPTPTANDIAPPNGGAELPAEPAPTPASTDLPSTAVPVDTVEQKLETGSSVIGGLYWLDPTYSVIVVAHASVYARANERTNFVVSQLSSYIFFPGKRRDTFFGNDRWRRTKRSNRTFKMNAERTYVNTAAASSKGASKRYWQRASASAKTTEQAPISIYQQHRLPIFHDSALTGSFSFSGSLPAARDAEGESSEEAEPSEEELEEIKKAIAELKDDRTSEPATLNA
ncbi:hypothetical protein NUW54_g9798 [Trametes sanguinea]|uniref:Uncharacterized protein n=1 Tax=Trametes sanguinea TaxID=158606 RepID=A0ACC1P535_9APHY|nr:hypothetical protein NUW54_g9798 [Trametes sanguinea]